MKAAQLLELVVARQQGAENPAIQQLLTRLRDGSGAGTNMQDMLAHFAQTNPLLGLLAQRRGAAPGSTHTGSLIEGQVVDGTVADVSDSPASEPRGHSEVTARDLANSPPALSDQTWTDLCVFRERVDRCAAALGACGLCWGADPECRACRGRGRPGFSLPDESLFQELVLPAVRMMRTYRAGTVTNLRSADAPSVQSQHADEATQSPT